MLNSVGGRVVDASELCHRMLDFCQRLTTAKRKILEDPELYPETETDMQVRGLEGLVLPCHLIFSAFFKVPKLA